MIDFTKYSSSLIGLGAKFYQNNYKSYPLNYHDVEVKSLAFDSTFNSVPKTTKYYEKLTLVYCPFTPKDFRLYDYNDKKGVEKSKNKGGYNTVYSFKNDGSVSFEIISKNSINKTVTLSSVIKKPKLKTKTFYYLRFNGKELKINNKTIQRLISTCVINKSKIETPIILLKEKRSWTPYSVYDYTAKQAMNPPIKCNKSTIGDLSVNLEFDYTDCQKGLAALKEVLSDRTQ